MTLDPIAKPIAAVLAFFYSLVPNYFVSIFLLTVGVMIILTPLTIKQTRSMLVMQKLQPELKKLQDRAQERPPSPQRSGHGALQGAQRQPARRAASRCCCRSRSSWPCSGCSRV